MVDLNQFWLFSHWWFETSTTISTPQSYSNLIPDSCFRILMKYLSILSGLSKVLRNEFALYNLVWHSFMHIRYLIRQIYLHSRVNERYESNLSALVVYFTTPSINASSLHGITNVFNSSPSAQNGSHLADDIFKYIFMNEKFCIFLRISLKFVCEGPTYNKSVLVQVMAWRRTGDKPLSEPMLIQFTDAYMRL